jgi:hypothetical protein
MAGKLITPDANSEEGFQTMEMLAEEDHSINRNNTNHLNEYTVTISRLIACAIRLIQSETI